MIVDILFAIAACLFVTSHLFRDMLWLRLLAVAGGTFYIIGGLFMPSGASGQFSLIFFSALNMLINVYHSIRLILNRYPIVLTDEVKDIYYRGFSELTPEEFSRLYQVAEIISQQQGSTLTAESEPVLTLTYILEGQVAIIKQQQTIVTLGADNFIGDMSCISGKSASADVKVSSGQFKGLVWSKLALSQIEKREPALYAKLKHIIALALVKKIELSSKNKINPALFLAAS